MIATLATAATLLVPFLAVVLVGALAVAIHDAIARAWAGRRTPRASATAAARRRRSAPRGADRYGAPALVVRPGATPHRRPQRTPAVLVR